LSLELGILDMRLGTTSATKIPMMHMTTNISVKEKPAFSSGVGLAGSLKATFSTEAMMASDTMFSYF
jgi:hypothetical protein